MSVRFASASPPEGMLEQVVRCASGEAFRELTSEGIKLKGGDIVEGQWRWLARYMPSLCKARQKIHAVHPMGEVIVRARC